MSRPPPGYRLQTSSSMSPKTRRLVLLVSTPVLAFALIRRIPRTGGCPTEDTYQHLRLFEDVVSLITSNYVEPVEYDAMMAGALRGLADGLDADSSYLTPEEARLLEQGASGQPAAGVGLELTRQYYLRIIAARDNSPGARANLTTGDYIRAIDGKSTRDMSLVSGAQLLRGAPGSKVTLTILRGNAAEPHDIVLVRERESRRFPRARSWRPPWAITGAGVHGGHRRAAQGAGFRARASGRGQSRHRCATHG